MVLLSVHLLYKSVHGEVHMIYSGVWHKSIWSTSFDQYVQFLSCFSALASSGRISDFCKLNQGGLTVSLMQTYQGPALATFLGFVPVSLRKLFYLPPLIRLLRLTCLGSGKKDGLGPWHRKLSWGNWPDRDIWLFEVSGENMLSEKESQGNKLVLLPPLSFSSYTYKVFKLKGIVRHLGKFTYPLFRWAHPHAAGQHKDWKQEEKTSS